VTRGRGCGLLGFFHGEAEESERRRRQAVFEYLLVGQPGKLCAVRLKQERAGVSGRDPGRDGRQ
jgi:hypothetical protein